jgi:hypothetical protein
VITGFSTKSFYDFSFLSVIRASIIICVFSLSNNTLYADEPQASPDSAKKTFDGFAAVRAELLGLMGGATQTIKLTTNFLSDGDIVSALYIAQYRKVSVQVLLGQAKATAMTSRLNYLKQQNVPVRLRPHAFFTSYPTVVLIDQSLYTLDAELDSMARHRKFTLAKIDPKMIASYVEQFAKAQSEGYAPTAVPLPLVGRARTNGKVYQTPVTSLSPALQPAQTNDGQSVGRTPPPDGAYKYSHYRDKPGKGVATKLPKTTILQNKTGKPSTDHQLNVDPQTQSEESPD